MCRGSVSMGLTKPINFEKRVLKPINFKKYLRKISQANDLVSVTQSTKEDKISDTTYWFAYRTFFNDLPSDFGTKNVGDLTVAHIFCF